RITALIGKINLHENDSFRGDTRHSTRMRIELVSGETIEDEQVYIRGSRNNPLDWSELATKFLDLSSGVISADQALSIVDSVSELPESHDVGSALVPHLVPA